MMEVKICGLSRMADIEAVNAARPDYCGFVVNVPKSRRNVDVQTLRVLRAALGDDIMAVGVFVDGETEEIAALLNENVLHIAQLHGHEDETDIAALRRLTARPIWQAFQIRSVEDVRRASRSSADFILLDAGAGGGTVFDWSLLAGLRRPFALAGGLNTDNIPSALKTAASVLDVSSGAETEGKKDPEKIHRIVKMIKGD